MLQKSQSDNLLSVKKMGDEPFFIHLVVFVSQKSWAVQKEKHYVNEDY